MTSEYTTTNFKQQENVNKCKKLLKIGRVGEKTRILKENDGQKNKK